MAAAEKKPEQLSLFDEEEVQDKPGEIAKLWLQFLEKQRDISQNDDFDNLKEHAL